MKKRSVHDHSSYSWRSFKAGEVVPLRCQEVIANQTVQIRNEGILRLDALDRPTMHPLRIKIFDFYCANRQVWPFWNDFITQGFDGGENPAFPYVDLTSTTGTTSTLGERLGLGKIEAGNTERVSALPFAHFWNIYDKYFRDPTIQEPIPVELVDGDNTALVGTLWGVSSGTTGFFSPNANWKKDYFNTANVDPQLGTAVPIPQSNISRVNNAPSSKVYLAGTNTLAGAGGGLNKDATQVTNDAGSQAYNLDNSDGLEMDESAVMRDLSIAGALQLFKEARQEVGSRIIDYLRSVFGSKISSYELQEPVMINEVSKTVRFSEVLQTAADVDTGTSETTGVGALRGHGIAGLGSNTGVFTCPENGFIITLALVMPEPVYLGCAEKFWKKFTFTDYFQPEFEPIGEQAIYDWEIGFGKSSNTGIFGHTLRYDDYRRCLSTVAGTFATTDKNWHMARDFGTGIIPALNPAFLIGAPTQRIFQDTTAEVYKLFTYHEVISRSIVKRFVRKRIL